MSLAEAHRRIAREKEERTGVLILHGLGLEEIPTEVGELTHLHNLDLGFNEISDVSSLSGLSGLTELNLDRNQISDLRGLEGLMGLIKLSLNGNEISDLRGLVGLVGLTELYLDSNEISDLRSLEGLVGLKKLYLVRNQISDLSGLAGLVGLTSLSLRNNQISDLNGLASLVGLTELDLNGNEISDLRSLAGLVGLTALSLSSNEISDLRGLAGLVGLTALYLSNNQISDLRGLAGLVGLTKLDLDSNKIGDLRGLAGLVGLTTLSLNGNQISHLRGLEGLESLTSLYLNGNEISDLSGLAGLVGLTRLYLRGNQISDVRVLAGLEQLERVDLDNNQIRQIPKLLVERDMGWFYEKGFYGLESGINVNENPVVSPPVEVIKQGREAMLEWFAAEKKELNEIKVILIGEPKAGKTSLLKRLKSDDFDALEPQTDGINIERIAFGESESFMGYAGLKGITGRFWDFGGQEIMHATHQFFLTNRSVYVLVLDARKDSLVAEQIRPWVSRIRQKGGDSPILVVANQCDVNPGFGFDNEYELQREFPQIKAFLRVSCKEVESGDGLEAVKAALAEWVPKAEFFHTEIDERWFPVKEELEKRTGEEHYLSQKAFVAICKKHGLETHKEQRSVIAFLHDLGLVLHFPEVDTRDFFVLDPLWITYGAYQILTSQLASKQKGEVGMAEDLAYILNEEEDKSQPYVSQDSGRIARISYGPNEGRFIADILHQFKLSYYLPQRAHFILPDLLGTQEPKELTQPLRQANESLRFDYKYDYLPKSLMPFLMVELHHLLSAQWRTGCVLLGEADCQALLTTYNNRLLVAVVGTHKQKREFLSAIRYRINEVNRRLKVTPTELVPLPGGGEVEHKELLQREQGGQVEYDFYDSKKGKLQKHTISKLLEGIAAPSNREWMEAKLDRLLDGQTKQVKKLDDLLYGQERIYQGLITKLDSMQVGFHEDLEEALATMETDLQVAIKEDMRGLLKTATGVLHGELSDAFDEVMRVMDSSGDTELKLKLGIPLLSVLGVQVEASYDLKGKIRGLFNKYSLPVLRAFGKA